MDTQEKKNNKLAISSSPVEMVLTLSERDMNWKNCPIGKGMRDITIEETIRLFKSKRVKVKINDIRGWEVKLEKKIPAEIYEERRKIVAKIWPTNIPASGLPKIKTVTKEGIKTIKDIKE